MYLHRFLGFSFYLCSPKMEVDEIVFSTRNNNRNRIEESGISQDCIESAYCFIHQKLRVYEFSNNPTQRDDIEYAISQYVEGMNPALYQLLADGRKDFLLDHTRFEEDMRMAQDSLEKCL